MAINTEDLRAFIKAAPGTRYDPDGMYGIQCVDLIDAYCVYLWGNWQNTIRAGNAAQLWTAFNPAYFDPIPNVAGDLNNFPRMGDVVIWRGDSLNPYGHIAIVVSADAYTLTVLQQNADGLAKNPAAIGKLKYDQPGTGPVVGWLRPKVSDDAPLAQNQRVAGPAVQMHTDTTLGSPSPRTVPAGSREVFTVWRKGETVTAIDGAKSDIWYGDSPNGPWVSALYFDPFTTAGLTDVTPVINPSGSTKMTANQRKVGPAGAVMRKDAEVKPDNVIRQISPSTTETFTRYRHGQSVTGSGGFTTDLWYGDADGWTWSGGYETQSTDGLTADEIPAPPPPIVIPPVGQPPVVVPPVETELDGVDVSNHQKAVDFKAIGAKFVIIRASEGGDGKPDPMLATHVQNARAAGCRVEFYHYSHIGHTVENTPELEAECFLEVVRPFFKPGDVVNLDWESSAIDLARGDLAVKWMDIVRDALSCKVRFYTYLNVLVDHAASLAVIRNSGYHLWLAVYPTAMGKQGFNKAAARPDVPGWTVDVWQYSSTGQIAGYAGNLDLNRMYLTLDTTPSVDPTDAGLAKLIAELGTRISAQLDGLANLPVAMDYDRLAAALLRNLPRP